MADRIDRDLVRAVCVVRSWSDEEGWGVLDSEATPDGCWAHFSAIHMPGYRTLLPGSTVTADVRPGHQDGYAWVAEDVWPGGADVGADAGTAAATGTSDAYSSRLVLTADDGTVLYDSADQNPSGDDPLG